MKVSLNEIEQTVLKAARGAGLAWGEAEDVAAAARWLAWQRMEWLERLVGVLETYSEQRETNESAIFLAAKLSDDAALEHGVTVAAASDVAWLCAHAAAQAVAAQRFVAVRAGEGAVAIDPHGAIAAREGALPEAATTTVARVLYIGDAGEGCAAETPSVGARVVGIDFWRRLEDLAAITYVPASETSRMSGAGAGTSDND